MDALTAQLELLGFEAEVVGRTAGKAAEEMSVSSKKVEAAGATASFSMGAVAEAEKREPR